MLNTEKSRGCPRHIRYDRRQPSRLKCARSNTRSERTLLTMTNAWTRLNAGVPKPQPRHAATACEMMPRPQYGLASSYAYSAQP